MNGGVEKGLELDEFELGRFTSVPPRWPSGISSSSD